jgi:tetratricopeptide (TPR) repeat protein
MARIRHGMAPVFALVLWLGASTLAQAVDDAPKLTLSELNNLTGAQALESAFKILLQNKAEAKTLIDAARPLAKKNAGLSYNAALVLALVTSETKDLPASEAFFRVCMDKAAKLQSTEKLSESYGGLIGLLYDNKKYAESARVCRELIELDTDDGKPRVVLVPMLTPLGQADFEEEDKFDPAKGIRLGVNRLLIQSVAKQGKFDQALKLVDNLIKITDHWRERELKGRVLREAGNYPQAAKVYEDVIKLIPKDKLLEPERKEAFVDGYRYLLSNIYLDMGKVDEASDQLEQLLAKRPDDPGYNNDLGYIWADNNMKLDEAEKLIRKALDLDKKKRQAAPDYDPKTDHDKGAYLDSLGWVLFKKGQFEEAKKMLMDAVTDKESQHIEIFDHLGDAHLKLGEKTEALAAWRKGLEVVGDDPRELKIKASVEKKIESNK